MTIPYPNAPVRALHPYDVPSALEVYAEWTRLQCSQWHLDPDVLEHCQRHLQQIAAVSDSVQRARTFLSLQSHLREITAPFTQMRDDHGKNIMPVPAIFHATGEIASYIGEALVVLDTSELHLHADDRYAYAQQTLHNAYKSFALCMNVLDALHDSFGNPEEWWSADADRRALSRGISIRQHAAVARQLEAIILIIGGEVARSMHEHNVPMSDHTDTTSTLVQMFRIAESFLSADTRALARASLMRAGKLYGLQFQSAATALTFCAPAATVAFLIGAWDVARAYTHAIPPMDGDDDAPLAAHIHRIEILRSLCVHIPSR